MEINGEGVKCKICLDGGDKLSVWTIWTVEINMDGGDKLSIWSIWTVEIIYLDYLDGGDKHGRW